MEGQTGIKIAGRNINNLRYDDSTLMAESKEELKSLLMKVKEENEKFGLKQHSKNKVLGIRSHHFMAKNAETLETATDFIFLGSKITSDGDLSHEIKRCLLLVRKAMTNLDSILKSRDITLPKVRLVKDVFSSSGSWTVKKTEHQRIDAFELCCCRRLLRIP